MIFCQIIEDSPEQEEGISDYVYEYLFDGVLLELDKKTLIEFADHIYMFSEKIKIKMFISKYGSGVMSNLDTFLEIKFVQIPSDFDNNYLREFFALIHSNLNELFSFMNSKNTTRGGHYHADPSKNLIGIIDETRMLQANLKQSEENVLKSTIITKKSWTLVEHFYCIVVAVLYQKVFS